MTDPIDQIEAVLNDQQAQIEALKVITQSFSAMMLFAQPAREQLMQDWRRNTGISIQSHTGLGNDQATDEAMRARMHLAAHDYFDALEGALRGAHTPPQSGG